MKLATLAEGGPDGTLVVVSTDGRRCLFPETVTTLQQALESWATATAELQQLTEALRDGAGEPTTGRPFAAPLPRAWQWLDGSAFESHGHLMQKAFGLDPIDTRRPLMYQGLSHRFIGPTEDVPLPRETDGIDFEGEFGIIVDEVPMGTDPGAALQHIRLVVMINDWSLRALAPVEMKTGFGWIQAKPACSAAPFALTPDELGPAWRDARVHLDLDVSWNGQPFGHANGGAMGFGFHELVAHAAATRSLCAGTIIGSGTVSNANIHEVGSSCIAERRGLEIVEQGEPKTPFMRFGDAVRMEAKGGGDPVWFGVINQRVVSA